MPILYQKVVALFMIAGGFLNATSMMNVYLSPWFDHKRRALVIGIASAILMLIGVLWFTRIL